MLEHKEARGEDLEKSARSLTLSLPRRPACFCSFSDSDLRPRSVERIRVVETKRRIVQAARNGTMGRVQKPKVKTPLEYDVTQMITELKCQRLDEQVARFADDEEGNAPLSDRFTAIRRPGTPMPNRKNHHQGHN